MSLAIQYHMKRKNGKETKETESTPIKMENGASQPMAKGGPVCMSCGGEMMAEGGELADFDSADFDAGGFEGKEANDTGANSGDELSDEGEEERKKSILSRILLSRSKKAGHNPRPD